MAVSEAGAIAANAPSIAALDVLRAAQTLNDQKRGTLDAQAYSVSVGVTTNVDMGAFVIPGLPDIQESFAADTLASADPFRMYDAFAALHREGKLSARLRIFFLSMDTKPDVPMLKQRLLNNMNGFGDDMMRVSGVGEFATSWPLFGQPAPTNYVTALQLVAKQGWPFQQHSLSPAEDKLTIDTFEAVNKTTPIAPLHWSIAHAPRIDPPTIARFKALGAGVAVHPFAYLAGAPGAGPPLRTIVDSGIHVGAGSDSAQISTLDPWLMIYYMVTGKNSSGVLINGGPAAHARRGAPAVHGGERLVPARRGQVGDHRARQARRCGRPERRLLRPGEGARRSDQAVEVGAHRRRRPRRARRDKSGPLSGSTGPPAEGERNLERLGVSARPALTA